MVIPKMYSSGVLAASDTEVGIHLQCRGGRRADSCVFDPDVVVGQPNAKGTPMAETSAKSFLKILERSRIVPEDRLKTTLAALSKKSNGKLIKVDELTKHLIQSGVLTKWHCEKLLAGKYKGFFLGKYKLLGHLGTGGMSSVYLAEHKLSGQKRAIKVLPRKKVSDKSYLDRFYREGKAAASLNHPNIVRIYDICNEGDTHYMVMEWVDGIDLYELVKKDGPLPFDSAAQYIKQAAKGLHHAHQRNLVHRDIKPANLLLARDDTVKILDLGLALMREEAESLTVMHNERVMGTADYLAPEQAVNSHDVDHRADIYSLGCTLYYCLTGHPPFPDGTLAQRIAMHQHSEPAPIKSSREDCPDALVDICEHMMIKNADERFQTAPEVETAFANYLETGEFRKDETDSFAIVTRRRATKNTAGDSLSTSPNAQAEREEPAVPLARKSKPPIPIWALITIVVLMFAALVLVLIMAIQFSGAGSSDQTRNPSNSTLQHQALLDEHRAG